MSLPQRITIATAPVMYESCVLPVIYLDDLHLSILNFPNSSFLYPNTDEEFEFWSF